MGLNLANMVDVPISVSINSSFAASTTFHEISLLALIRLLKLTKTSFIISKEYTFRLRVND
jgi:hypothetical protein